MKRFDNLAEKLSACESACLTTIDRIHQEHKELLKQLRVVTHTENLPELTDQNREDVRNAVRNFIEREYKSADREKLYKALLQLHTEEEWYCVNNKSLEMSIEDLATMEQILEELQKTKERRAKKNQELSEIKTARQIILENQKALLKTISVLQRFQTVLADKEKSGFETLEKFIFVYFEDETVETEDKLMRSKKKFKEIIEKSKYLVRKLKKKDCITDDEKKNAKATLEDCKLFFTRHHETEQRVNLLIRCLCEDESFARDFDDLMFPLPNYEEATSTGFGKGLYPTPYAELFPSIHPSPSLRLERLQSLRYSRVE